MNLEIAVETVGPWNVVNLRGRIDAASASAFDSSLRGLIGSGASRILINCAELRYVSSVGIGMIVVVPPDRADETLRLLTARGETATLLGEVRAGTAGVVIHE